MELWRKLNKDGGAKKGWEQKEMRYYCPSITQHSQHRHFILTNELRTLSNEYDRKKNLSRPEWSTDSPTPSLSTSSSGSRGSRLPGTSSPKSERRPAIQLDRQSNVYVVASRLKICNVYRIKFNLQFKKVIILCYLHSVWYDNKFNISYLSLTIKHRKILQTLKSSACLACSVIQQAHDVHLKINLVKAVDEEAPFYTPDHFY